MPAESDASKKPNSEESALLNNKVDCNTWLKNRTAPEQAAVPFKAWTEDDDCGDCNSDSDAAAARLKPNIFTNSEQRNGTEIKSMLSNTIGNQPRHSITSKKNAGCIIKVWDPQEKLLHRYDLRNKAPRDWRDYWEILKKYAQKLQPPYFIMSFVLVVVLVYVSASDSILSYLEFSGERRLEVWRLVSYMTAHRGAAHAALNAAFALAVGAPLEREQGAARAAAVGALGGVAGAMGAATLHPQLRLVGASAAVYAMLTSHLGHVCLNYSTLSLKWFRLLAVTLLALSDTVWLLWYRQSDHLQLIAWTAHSFGALTGFLLAFLVYKGSNTESKYLLAAKWTSAIILGIGFAVILFFYAYQLLYTVTNGLFPGKM